jgi:hypothetical protein
MPQNVQRSKVILFIFSLLLTACGPGQGGAPPTVGDGSGDEGAYLFDDSVVRTYAIELSDENLAFLDSSPAREEYVQGAIVIDGERIDSVGIRYKGGVGSFTGCVGGGPGGILDVSGPKICPKLGMKISFNLYVENRRWKGLKKLQFHAMNQDASYMKEALGYQMFQDFGVGSSRTAFARLEMNGEFSGLFILIEELDSTFTESRFGDIEGGEGNLYKDYWPGRPDLAEEAITGIRPDVTLNGSLRTNREEPDLNHDTMVGFSREFQAALEISEEAVDLVVDRWMDVEYFHKYIAVDRALEANDGPLHFFAPGAVGSEYTGVGWNHNYYWYAAFDEPRLWAVPWDLDLTLGAGITDSWIQDEWNDLEAPCVLKPNILPFFPPSVAPACDPLVRSLARRQQAYRKVVVALLEGPFSERVVNAKLARWEELLTPYVVEEVKTGKRRDRGDRAKWEGEVQRLRDHLATRRVEIAASIDY